MELTIYDIIRGPVISDKAYKLNRAQNKLVLEVHVDSNKSLIKDALEKLFDVKVESVRTLIRKDTNTRVASRRYNAKPSVKKRKIAYVTLAEGHAIAALNLSEQVGAPAEMDTRKTAELA